MPEHPAEIPAENEGGSGRIDLTRIRGGIGGPNELPPQLSFSVSQLVNEVFRLRNRVHSLESNMLAARIGGRSSFGGVIGGPQELPAESEGGGGGVIGGGVIPHEIHEIAELQASRLVAELSNLAARFTALEKNISQQLATISQRLDAKR
jgi:hypothetical protein